jgi:hypothetical protein
MVCQAKHRARLVALVGLALVAVIAAGCGGDDGAASSTTTRPTGGAAQPTTSGAPGATTSTTRPNAQQTTTTAGGSAAAGKLPDGCGLFDDAAASTAMGAAVASKNAPQPANEIMSRCDWTGGIYSIGLTVRKGTNAKSSFDNVVSSGFSSTPLTGADARVNLGARETSRNYRLVSYAAYNGTYFVHVVLQGRDRADAEATDAAATLVRATLSKLGA